MSDRDLPFPPNPHGGPQPPQSKLWVRPNRNLDWTSIHAYALTFDGYKFAEAIGFDIPQFTNQHEDQFRRTGEWHGSFQELRCCLFGQQRGLRWGNVGPGESQADLALFSLNQAVADVWDREHGLPELPSRYKKDLQHAVAAAQSAGGIVREHFHRGEASKADHKADQQIRDILKIAFPDYGYRGEEIGLVAKPSDADKHLWLVDPQDGTSAASKGFRGAAVSIALLRDGQLVLGVVYACTAPDSTGDLFFWAEGMQGIQHNNDRVARQWPDRPNANGIALISQHADRAAEANAKILAPLRYRPVPGIAYRLALVASGEGDLAVSLNGPTGWDVAGGHALLIGAGGDLFNQAGELVRYDSTGMPQCAISTCFGGTHEVVRQYAGKSWRGVMQATSPAVSKSLSFLAPGQLIEDPLVLGRAQGCLLGQLAGDALGSLVEFSSPQQIAHRYPNGPSLLEDGGTWSTIAGQPTDDSELALALARSIVQAGDYDTENAATAYARWKQSAPFDIGNTTRTALSAAALALKSKGSAATAAMTAANRGSQANGALMRISPLGIFASSLDAGVAMDMARQDAKLTHPHEVCQDANAVFVATLGFAIRSGASKSEVYDYAIELAVSGSFEQSVVDRLRAAGEHPRQDFTSQMGWVLIAFQNAFFRLLHAESIEDGVVDTVRAGGDTDTNAAIVGALLGAVHGRDRIPKQWVDRLLACRPIGGLEDIKHPRPAEYWPVDALVLAENLLVAGERKSKRPRAQEGMA